MNAPTFVSDWTALTLDAGGRSLIEASAGTGKTWTISVLYLRLLLERALSVRQIVVTTFTEAAAQELRERIRGRLMWALAQVGAATADHDAGEAAVARWLQARDAVASRDRLRLRLALAELDLAPIGTLHGLCQRILRDFPLVSGAPFEAGMIVDATRLRSELLDDLWRRLVQSSTPLAPDDAVAWQLGRRRLEQYLRAALAPGVVVPAADSAAIESFLALLDPAQAPAIMALAQAPVYARSNSALRTRLLEVAERIGSGRLDRDLAADLGAEILDRLGAGPQSNFHRDAIAEGRHHAVAAEAQRIGERLCAGSRALLQRVLARCQSELRERAEQRLMAAGELTYDALITRVQAALGDGSDRLGGQLHATWPVALVDEFQDTDALQYDILDRIYRAPDGSSRGRLIMIGDPKQAIYRFRGGDIDAYLAARSAADEQMTLAVNFRSSPAYVAALDELYASAGRVLSSQPGHAIACGDVAAAPGRADSYSVAGRRCTQPLQIHYLASAPPDAATCEEEALRACANHIVALLDGSHALDGVALQPRNLAVLLPAHRHIATLRELLQQRRVPCVSRGAARVFDSEWARELQVLLHAALHPGDAGAVRAALATELGACDWQRLRTIAADADLAQEASRWLHELGEVWRRRGVLALVQALIEQRGAVLAARADLERALTDLRHLGELLQAQSEQATGRDELLAWLADQRGAQAAGRTGDEQELRIESDAARVSLLTVHASKGLEFDIVLLPIMWKAQPAAGEVVTIHDAASGQRVLGFDAAARARDDCEVQDERHRLLYVALTRARHACHVYALPPSRPARRNGRSAATDPQRAPLDAMLERLLAADAPARLKHVAWSTAGWPWPPAQWSDAVATPSARSARNEPPAVPLAYRYSFSALARRAARTLADEDAAGDEREVAAVELAAVDAAPAAQPCAALEPLLGVVGTAFGNAVHAVFESRRIGVPLSAQHELVASALRDARVRVDGAHGGVAATALVARLAERLQGVLDAPLPVGRHSQPSLGGLAAQAQRAEMEFNFVLDGVSLRALREVCPWAPGESFGDLRGLMNGKIDLVFEHEGRCHVVDYKTNRLGDGRDLAAYLPARLDAPMDEHHYRFQALLYTVAVERYLRQRRRDYRREHHLGATLYLFVRAVGIDPALPQAGIWTHRFDDDLLDAVDRVLAGRKLARGDA